MRLVENTAQRSTERTSDGPRRVVFLLEDLEYGGTQRQTIELASRLDRAEFSPELWTLEGGVPLSPAAEAAGLVVRVLSSRRHTGPASLWRLYRELRARKVDSLVLMTVLPNIWGRLVGRLAGVPAILATCRGGGSPRRQHERRLWRLADHIICNSQDLKRVLVETCGVPDHRVTVILNGVDTDSFKVPEARPASSKPVILSVARLVPDKDHETLIRAFARASRQHPGAQLWLVGEGECRNAITNAVNRESLQDAVRIIDPQPDIRPILSQAALFVLSSVREGLPNAILEAMASGLPVVATDAGGVREVVRNGETGWIVPCGDHQALAERITGLLDDPAMRKSFGDAGRRRALDEFSMTVMVNRHEAILRTPSTSRQ